MPYANREQQLEAMREWRRRRKLEHAPQEAQRPAPAPPPSTRPARREPTSATRRYWTEREQGKSDSDALDVVLRERTTTRVEQRQERDRQHQEIALQVRALGFMDEARAYLRGQGGFSETDVVSVALAMSARSFELAVPPRQGDAPPKLLGEPMPRPPQAQPTGPVWMGALRRVAHALGDGRAAAQEQGRTKVQELIAVLLRQPVTAPARANVAQALAVSPVGIPRGLGAPVADGEMSEV